MTSVRIGIIVDKEFGNKIKNIIHQDERKKAVKIRSKNGNILNLVLDEGC